MATSELIHRGKMPNPGCIPRSRCRSAEPVDFVVAHAILQSQQVFSQAFDCIRFLSDFAPAVGVSRANELISAGVSVIIEGWNSPVTLAMQPVISRAGGLDITAISKADPILSGEGNPLAIRLNSSNTQDGAVIANYIA